MGSEEEQRSALYAYQKASLEDLKRKKKKRRIKIIVCFLAFCFLCVFVSSFNILPKFFPKYLRYYDVRLNGMQLSVAENIEDSNSLFGLFSIRNGVSNYYSLSTSKTVSLEEMPFYFTLKSYSCYIPSGKKKIKTSCEKIPGKDFYENQDTSYKNMRILKYDYEKDSLYLLGQYRLLRSYMNDAGNTTTETVENHSVLYEGKFISDLTPYIREVGVYTILIDFSYKKNTGTLMVGVINDGEKIFSCHG